MICYIFLVDLKHRVVQTAIVTNVAEEPRSIGLDPSLGDVYAVGKEPAIKSR